MKYIEILKEFYEDLSPSARLRFGLAIAVMLIFGIIYSAFNDHITKLERKRASREVDVTEMMQLKAQYQRLNAGMQMLANRLAATKPDDTPSKVVEETGIKGKNIQFKPVKGETHPDFIEDAVEAKIEGLSANDAINLLFRLEKGSRPVLIKKALIRTEFNDPSKLDMTLNLALLKAPQKSPK